MAATRTVSQLSHSRNLLAPRHGVVTLFGYGVSVYVDRGHLVLKDGIGSDRHEARFSRVGHGLRRLVIIGSDGFVSLARGVLDNARDVAELRGLSPNFFHLDEDDIRILLRPRPRQPEHHACPSVQRQLLKKAAENVSDIAEQARRLSIVP